MYDHAILDAVLVNYIVGSPVTYIRDICTIEETKATALLKISVDTYVRIYTRVKV